jgi:hypothetical protein
MTADRGSAARWGTRRRFFGVAPGLAETARLANEILKSSKFIQ